jgi:enolase
MLKVFSKSLKNKNFIIKSFSDIRDLEILIRKFESKYGKIGANACYALETCFLKACAKENKKEMWKFIYDSFYEDKKPKIPLPLNNCIGGGLHSKSRKKPDFQEFLLIPKDKKFSKAITRSIHAYRYAKKLLKKKSKKKIVSRNDEGAWDTILTNKDALDILKEIGKKYKLKIGLDIAGSSFFNKGYYYYKNKELIRDRLEQIEYIERLIKKYKLFYIEDPLQEEDFSGFAGVLKKSKEVLIAGDDLTTTNIRRIIRGFKNKSINAVIIKPNQIGYLTEMAKAVEFCRKNNLKIVFSHRSGETMDDAIADFAVGFQADFFKCSVFGKERLIKLRKIIEIQKSL